VRIGFIGLGIMGSSMALNVRAAGHDLAVYDIRREAAAPHLAAGAKWADQSTCSRRDGRGGLYLAAGPA